MTQKMKEESENPGNHHDDDGIIDNGATDNGLEDNADFMGLTRMMMIPVRLKNTAWMR